MNPVTVSVEILVQIGVSKFLCSTQLRLDCRTKFKLQSLIEHSITVQCMKSDMFTNVNKIVCIKM
jgi:hypothetical protein